MTCKFCGAPCNEGANFCRNCGNPIPVMEKVEAETISEPEPVMTMDDFDYEYKSSKSTGTQGEYSSSNYPNNSYPRNYYAPSGGSIALSIVSMILGILSVVFCCVSGFNIIGALAALVCGIIALVTGKNGRGMAIAGVVTGAIGLVLGIGVTFIDARDIIFDILDLDYLDEFEDVMEYFEF